ncbi:MAG TPA: ABC transporter ATP-binding protein [Firmicutes bacterium]|nr:ABC transporter ATP-binding protein [Bacillota bacterium]
MKSIKWILNYLKPYSFKYGLAMLLVFLGAGLNMVNPMLSGKIIDDVMNGSNKQLLVPILLMMIGVVVIKGMTSYTYQLMFEFVSQDIMFQLREQCYTKLMTLDFNFYHATRTGDLMTRLTGDIETIRYFIASVIYSIFSNILVFIFAVVYMLSISPLLTISLLLITPVIAMLTIKMSKEVGPTFHQIREAYSSLNSVVQENISGNRVVKAFAREAYEIEKFEKENLNYREKNLASSRIWQKYLPVLDSSAGALSVIMIFIGGILVMNQMMTLGDIVVFNGLIWALNNPMRMAGWLVNDVQRFIAAGDKIRDLLDANTKLEQVQDPVSIPKIKGNIKFENVSFSYGDELVLDDVSFEVKSGQTVGIIGPTGSGKSTLVNLITRFYDATKGNIFVDGINIKQLDLTSYRKQIGTSLQDIFLFSDTIEGNIAFSDCHAEFEQVLKVSDIAQANDFITQLPEQYDTIIGERGVGLSGGQKQRISLARALLTEPSILILDDTTSAVDMETEHAIQLKLNTVLNNRTNFIIAHRISSVKDADIIMVLKDGKIIETGTHESLMEQQGYYYHVYQTQISHS